MIITITSQKGGVGKTTSAVSLAYALAEATPAGSLLVDLDPQGHCAISLGLDPAPGVYGWLINCLPLARVLTHARHRPPFTLLPGNSHTKLLDSPFVTADLPARLLDLAGTQPAPLIIDTPASGHLQESAIAVADHIIIPLRCELLGLDGVNATLALAAQLNPAAALHILPVGVDLRLREHNTILYELRENHPGHIAGIVPARVAVAEACALGLTIFEHRTHALAAVRLAYLNLLNTILAASVETAPALEEAPQ